ncbi:MAG: ATP-binding protein [Desulfobacterales bacterium]|jgi:signal transduction histidine kinase|nr:ATP-binding protein [Desulfobacterales bacterium]
MAHTEPKDVAAQAGAVAERPFLQPLAIALVALIVAGLFFTMAMFDVRRVERTLLNVLETKGIAIIQGVEHVAELRLARFLGIAENRQDAALDPSALDSFFTAQEALSADLIDLAADIDRQDASERPLSAERLHAIALAENLAAVVLLDAAGKIERQSTSLPDGIRTKIGSLLRPGEEIAVNLFSFEPLKTAYVGLRRKTGGGAVFIFLDREGIRQWGTRIALQEAAEEAGWRQGVDYLILADRQGRIIARFGEPPPYSAEEIQGAPIAGRQVRRFDRQAGNVLEVAELIRLSAELAGAARVGLDTRGVDELLGENRRHIFFSMGLMIGMGLLAMWFLYTNQNRHLRRIQNLSNRLHQTERLSSMGQLAAGVAHEIRNPLNAVSLAVQRIQREYAPSPAENRGEFDDLIRTVRQEIRRLDVTVEDFLSLARGGRLVLRPVAVVALLQSILLLVRVEADARGIRIETAWEEPGAAVVVDENRMRQALLNLIKNAFEAMSNSGSLRVSVKSRPQHRVGIEIADTGAGIPAGELERIFSPEYSTKEKGLGLGLAISLQIIRAHGGELKVASAPGRGTTFEILLPRSRDGA